MNNYSTHSSENKKEQEVVSLRPPPLMLFLNPSRLRYPCALLSGILTVILLGSIDLSVIGWGKAIGALFQCIATGYIAWAVIYSYSTLENHKQMFADLIKPQEITNQNRIKDKKYELVKEINIIYRSKTVYFIFALIALGLFSTVVFGIGNPLSPSSEISFYVTFAIFSLVAGFGGSTVFLIGRFMVRYANCPLSFSIFQYPYSQFRFIGQLQLKFAWITAIGYFFGASMTVFYWGIQPFTVFWLFIGIAFVIGFFIYPQLAFHKQLRYEKLKAIKDISDKIQRLFEESIKDPQTGNLKKLKEMHEFADLASKLPEWPFDVKALLSVMATVIIPVIIMFLQTLIRSLLGGG